MEGLIMSCQHTVSISLGASHAGLTLAAQLLTTNGQEASGLITDGFVEIGAGNYSWTYAFASGFRGVVKFIDTATDEIMAVTEVDPGCGGESDEGDTSDTEDLSSEIEDIARGPMTDTVDGATATSHPLPDLIEADRYLAGKRALRQQSTRSGWDLVRQAQVIKPRLP